MRLLLVRHAIAVPPGTSDMPDDDRPLTDEGRRKFRRVARGLGHLVRTPDALLTSPRRRARETADLLAVRWDGLVPVEVAALATGDMAAFEDALVALPADGLVVAVGHEPWLSELLAFLVDARAPERFRFRKGGAALLEVPGRLGEGGVLEWFARPRILARVR
jgi:phosphohistidine phosphatase